MNNFFSLLLIFIQILIISCSSGKDNSHTNTSAQIAVSYPGSLLGVSTPTLNKSYIKKNPTNSLPLNKYYIPIFNTGSTPVAVTSVIVESNINIWTATADSKCINGINNSSGNCNLIIEFNSALINNASELSSIIAITFSNGSTMSLPISGLIIANENVIMQAPKQIISNSNGKSYGMISVFNNSGSSFLIDEKAITANTGKWQFSVNCDGNGSKIINARSNCSIGIVNNTIEVNPTTVQISIPIINQSSYIKHKLNESQLINVTTTVIPFPVENAPYLIYLGGIVSLINTSNTTFPLLNLGIGSLNKITIDGLPNNIVQSNDCINILTNGVCNVTLNVIDGVAPPLFTLNIFPSNGIEGNTQQVAVTGQTLSISPLQINFGKAFSGSTVQKDITISNLGPNTLNYQIGTLNNNNFSINYGSCTNNNLKGFASCVFHINYLAPKMTEEDTANLVISSSTIGESAQTINMIAGSILAPIWTNIINSGGYTDSGSAISALISGADGSIILTIANTLNHVWQLSQDGTTWSNISDSFTNYYNQTITAFNISFYHFFVGGYIDGVISVCGINPGECISFLPPQPPFSVSSIINVTPSRGSVGFANADASLGKLMISDDFGGINTIPDITAGVGRIAIDGQFGNATNLFVPLSNGQIVVITDPWIAITGNITPSNFFAKEYATVLFYDLNTSILYAGTNLANVYKCVAPVSSYGWVKLTSSPLSNISYISSIATNTFGDIYVGLSNFSNKISGGGVYILPKGEINFIAAGPSYSDKSAVTNIVFDALVTNRMFVGTYLGNVWRQ